MSSSELFEGDPSRILGDPPSGLRAQFSASPRAGPLDIPKRQDERAPPAPHTRARAASSEGIALARRGAARAHGIGAPIFGRAARSSSLTSATRCRDARPGRRARAERGRRAGAVGGEAKARAATAARLCVCTCMWAPTPSRRQRRQRARRPENASDHTASNAGAHTPTNASPSAQPRGESEKRAPLRQSRACPCAALSGRKPNARRRAHGTRRRGPRARARHARTGMPTTASPARGASRARGRRREASGTWGGVA